jgi:hypothetical protein
MGFIIFCCGILYRFLILAEKEKKNNNDTKVINKETETKTGGIE